MNFFRSFDENGKNIYTLVSAPKSSQHDCDSDELTPLAEEFSRRCYKKAELDPLKSVRDVYYEARDELSVNLSDEDKLLFYSMISSLRNIESGLYQFRENFRPKAVSIRVSEPRFPSLGQSARTIQCNWKCSDTTIDSKESQKA